MAWQDFFIIGGSGDDLAGGSGTGAVTAADTGGNGTVLQGGGAGGGTSDRYTANSGTPFSATVANTDYVSIYTGTPVATSYVAKVTAVNASGASIDYDSTTGIGTRPASLSTWKAKTGGAWNSHVVIGGSGLNNAAVPSSTRVNWKVATYTLTGFLGLYLGGAASKPVWMRGYNTSPGDLDNGSATLSYPTISIGTNQLNVGNSFNLISGFAFSAARNGDGATGSGNGAHFNHCRFTNSSANSGANAFNINIQVNFANCYFSTNSTSAQIVTQSQAASFYGCFFDGANSGTVQNALVQGSNLLVAGCTFNKPGKFGISVATSASNTLLFFCGNTFNACLSDSINIASMPGANGLLLIANNAFFSSGGFDINNATGSNNATPRLLNNLTYNSTSGHLNAFGDWAESNALSDAADPRLTATDLHLLVKSAGAAAGLPGNWEQAAYATPPLSSQPDVGAWQRNASFPVGKVAGARSIGTY